ncbi:hypothetical protein Poli38472_009640 [Pythium oligandrum]|uniref:Translation initiation factor IF-3 n=1 Tax=Pythium oligandrum TaxID=41045 RepID=A0A8K1FJT5_PYTOL|nr:hypothetical protein Poli38472_009640 [Pythium oligandrum]|eukprot:TMW62147.1 hypothetical protein Poli38472_009640 [Pythium oligandrum]
MAAVVQRVSWRCAVLATARRGVLSAPRRELHARTGSSSVAFRVSPVIQSLQTARYSSNAKLGPLNDDIKACVVQVVGEDGKMRRDVPLSMALEEAREQGVDLVQVAENNGHVVCRLFDAQKRLFSLRKSAKNSKPKQDKEVVFGVKIAIHDIKVKAEQVRKFLAKGHKVKVTVKFGREFHLKQNALDQMVLIEEAIETDVGVRDHSPRDQYGGVYVHFAPKAHNVVL